MLVGTYGGLKMSISTLSFNRSSNDFAKSHTTKLTTSSKWLTAPHFLLVNTAMGLISVALNKLLVALVNIIYDL